MLLLLSLYEACCWRSMDVCMYVCMQISSETDTREIFAGKGGLNDRCRR